MGPLTLAATVYVTKAGTSTAYTLAKEIGVIKKIKRTYFRYRENTLPWYSFKRIPFIIKRIFA